MLRAIIGCNVNNDVMLANERRGNQREGLWGLWRAERGGASAAPLSDRCYLLSPGSLSECLCVYGVYSAGCVSLCVCVCVPVCLSVCVCVARAVAGARSWWFCVGRSAIHLYPCHPSRWRRPSVIFQRTSISDKWPKPINSTSTAS